MGAHHISGGKESVQVDKANPVLGSDSGRRFTRVDDNIHAKGPRFRCDMARDRAKSHKAHGFTMQAMQWTADGDMPLAPADSCVINGKSAADHEQQGKYVLGNFVHAGVKDVGDEDAPSRRRLDGDIVDPLAMMRDDLAAFETLDDLGGKEAMLMEQSIGADGFRHEARFAVVIWADEISGYTGKLILVTAKIV